MVNRNRLRIIIVTAMALVITLGTFNVAQADRTVILVRHAEKQSDAGKDPALTEIGEARAQALAGVLEAAGVTHIFTTQYKRTRDTAAIIAAACGVEITVTPSEKPLENHFKSVAAAVMSVPDNSTILVVGHSNTIPHIVTALGGRDMKGFENEEHSTMFIVRIDDAGKVNVIKANYGAPDPR